MRILEAIEFKLRNTTGSAQTEAIRLVLGIMENVKIVSLTDEQVTIIARYIADLKSDAK